jgi:hypothetical protein
MGYENESELAALLGVDSVGICVITHNNIMATKFFLNNLLKATNGYAKLYIYDYDSDDKLLVDYLKTFCEENDAVFRQVKKMKLASLYNLILKEVKQDYLALTPIHTLLQDGWLIELLYHYKNIENSGCVSIRNQHDEVSLSSVLFKNAVKDEDEMRLVYFKNPNVVDSMMFFKKSRLETVGYFDENFNHDGYIFNEFSFRFMLNGYINYMVKNVVSVKTYLEDDVLSPKKLKDGSNALKNEINEMVKQHIFKK